MRISDWSSDVCSSDLLFRFTSILAEYEKAPKIMRERMYLETMQQIFSRASKVMVDTKNNNNMLYLPLDKIMQQAARDVPVKPTALPGASQPTVPQPPARSTGASSSGNHGSSNNKIGRAHV